MAKRKVKNKKPSAKYKKYKGDHKYCPKCGPGVFLANHKNRETCGTCGYTVFKKE